MKTEFLNISDNFEIALKKAFDYLSEGNIIAVPTDTVYGLICDLQNKSAINRIFEIKRRSIKKPLIAFCDSIKMIESISENIPNVFYQIAEKYFPGPLTIILKKNSQIPNFVNSDYLTIGVRIPNNLFLLELLKNLQKPLASTSANISGFQSAVTAQQAFGIFNGQIPLILDSGKSDIGIESTVIDISDGNLKVLRESYIKKDDLLKFWK